MMSSTKLQISQVLQTEIMRIDLKNYHKICLKNIKILFNRNKIYFKNGYIKYDMPE